MTCHFQPVKVFRQLGDNVTIGQMLGQFPTGLDIERVSRIQRRVENVGRVCAFAQRKLDRVLFVRLSSTIVTFVKFERDVRLRGRGDGGVSPTRRISGRGNTYRVVQLGDPPVCNGQTGEEDKINKGMDMALFSEVEVQRAATTAPSRLEVFHDILEQWQRSEDTNFLPVEVVWSGKDSELVKRG